jgi:tRNA(Arg) A34 adenosine deaminase TadA
MFEDKVKRTIHQLQHHSFHTIAAEITNKRMAWLDYTLPELKEGDEFSPREVYELLFFEQMGLERDELPVILETDDEIIWFSFNPCSLLEACKALELDTREVCRHVNEKATQSFVSRINPELRFHRSYQEIRPFTSYCKEKIIRYDFNAYMRHAIHEAQIGMSEGNAGYGAVVVYEDQIIGKAHNTVNTDRDPSSHAEMNAIRKAVNTHNDQNLCGAILFSTCEPCAMCSTLAVWADLTTIVYGVSIEEMAALGKGNLQVSTRQVIEGSSCAIEVIGGIMKDECKALLVA